MNKILLILAVVIVLGGVYLYMNKEDVQVAPVVVTSFEECVAAGNPIMESYPRQCRTENGELFVEDIANEPGTDQGDEARVGDRATSSDEDKPRGETVAVEGTITEIDLEQMMVDGPARVSIETDDGTTTVITVPSMGLPLCAARASITDVATLAVGDSVSARGEVNAEGEVTPCEAADHYLRVTE